MDLHPVPVINYSTHILANLWQETLSGKTSVMFFSTGLTSGIQKTIKPFFDTLNESLLYHYFDASLSQWKEPYFPFINIARDFADTSGIPPGMLLDNALVYPPQRDIFMATLANTKPKRKDLLLLEEVAYEKSRIQRSVFALLRYISRQKPLVIVLDNLRCASPAIFDFILYILRNCGKSRIFFIFAYNLRFCWKKEEEAYYWETFLLAVKSTYTIFDIDQDSKDYDNLEIHAAQQIPPEEMVRLANLNFYFLAFEEALDYALKAYPLIVSQTGIESEALQYKILNLSGDAYYYTNRYNEAIIQYQAITDKAQRTDNYKQLSSSYRKTGFAYLAQGDISSAKRCSLLDIKITEEIETLQTSKNRMYSYFFAFLISLRNASNISSKHYFLLMDLLKSEDTKNMYAYFCGNSVLYSNYFFNLPDLLQLSDESIKYYRKMKNEFGLATAFHKKGILFSNNAQYPEALTFMKMSMKIQVRIGEPLSIVRIQNGIGYLYYLTGNYKKAFLFFKKSLHLLGTIENYEETTASLYNIAMVYFVTANFEQCANIINKILKIMYTLNVESLPYHSILDVYILKALCALQMHSYIKAVELKQKIAQESDYLPWKPKFLYALLDAMLLVHDDNIEKALSVFKNAPDILKASDEKNTDILPIYYFEYIKALYKSGKINEADTVFEKALAYCDNIGSQFNKKRILSLRENNSADFLRFDLSRLQVNLDTLVKLAKQEFVLNRLRNKMRDIRFLNILQTELMPLGNTHEVGTKFLKLVSHHLPIEILFFCLIEKGQEIIETMHVIPEDMPPEAFLPVLAKAITLPDKNQFFGPDLHREFPDIGFTLSTLVSIPILRNKSPAAWLFLATRKNDFNPSHEDMEILITAAGQIGLLFDKIQHEEEILRLSYEDELSGLQNRQSLKAKIRLETARIERTKNKSDLHFSVAFIDLDNFKYYNDTFGHGIGDLIIKEFSKLLISTFREIDFIVRYGGDEFVILMPETTSADAAIPLERIYSGIVGKNFFLSEIEQQLTHSVSIPEEKHISCSIGLASYEQGMQQTDTIEGLLQYADLALYEAKRSGKNKLYIYGRA